MVAKLTTTETTLIATNKTLSIIPSATVNFIATTLKTSRQTFARAKSTLRYRGITFITSATTPA